MMVRWRKPYAQGSYQLSAISYQLSAISYQLSAISYQLSAISYQLSEGIVSTLSFVKVCSSGQSILIPAMS
jgi:hypothetical protein